jgi:hypothetical protein
MPFTRTGIPLRSITAGDGHVTPFRSVSAPRGCTRDEGRFLEAGLQERASNHLKLQW